MANASEEEEQLAKDEEQLARDVKRAAIRARVEASKAAKEAKAPVQPEQNSAEAPEPSLFPLPRGFNATQACLLCTVLGAALYLGTLDAQFAVDDKKAIIGNADVTGTENPSPDWLAQLLANDFWGTHMSSAMSHKSYRPLTVLSFRLDHTVAGLSPAYFHAVNVAVYAAVCWVFTATAIGVLGGIAPGLGAGVLFAVHPVHTEAVCNVVGRAELLAGLFFLLAFRAFSRGDGEGGGGGGGSGLGSVVLSVFLAALAMVCKETGITAVAVCVTLDAVCASELGEHGGRVTPAFVAGCAAAVPRALGLGGASASAAPLKKSDDADEQAAHAAAAAARAAQTAFVRRALLAALCLGALLYWRMVALMHGRPAFLTLKHQNPAALHPDPLARALHRSYIYARNAGLLLWPQPLSYDWGMWTIPLVATLGDERNAASAVFYVALGALAYAALLAPSCRRATRRAATAGLAMLVFPFLPATNLLMPVGFVIAERTLFLPSMGACLLLALLATRLAARVGHRAAGAAPLLVLAVLFGARTLERVGDWRSEEALYESCLAALPNNPNCAYNLATVRGTQKRAAEAMALYRTAVELKPDFGIAAMNLGNGYARTKRFEEAEHFLRKSRSINPANPSMLLNLANIFLDNDKARGTPWARLDDAIGAVEDAVRLQPSNARAQRMLASFTKNQRILAARAEAAGQ